MITATMCILCPLVVNSFWRSLRAPKSHTCHTMLELFCSTIALMRDSVANSQPLPEGADVDVAQ
jgi:hypothetical protein